MKSENNNYCKKYTLNSVNNNYIVSFECIIKYNCKKLYIKLNHFQANRVISFYSEFFLEEIKNEYNFLSEYNTIESLIDYFAKLTKRNYITVDRINNLVYILYFYDKKKNKLMKIYLKRKIKMNQKNIEEIEEEILKMYKDLEKLNEINSINISKDNPNMGDKTLEIISNICSLNSTKDDFSDSNIYKKLYIINEISFKIINNSKCIINKINTNSKKDIIFKDNNNTIFFYNEPIYLNKKTIISDKKEKCELFNAFNIENGYTIIIWTVNNKPNIINYKWDNKKHQEIKAHNNKIDDLKYFHKETILRNNDYIISLSQNDEEAIKIWNIINENTLQYVHSLRFNTFGKLIDFFCLFNNINYSKENSYIFLYYESFIDFENKFNMQKEKEIICYKLDNHLQIVNWNKNHNNKIITCFDMINSIDTFYYRKEGKLYLINCNESNIKVFEDPLNDNCNGIYFNNYEEPPLSAFIVERNNNIELFEMSKKGIYIWDINNIFQPKSKIILKDFSFYDICLWNDELLWASTDSGFQLININNKNIIRAIDNCESKTFSKVRKINTLSEGYSIIGIDFQKNLCLYSMEVKQKK